MSLVKVAAKHLVLQIITRVLGKVATLSQDYPSLM